MMSVLGRPKWLAVGQNDTIDPDPPQCRPERKQTHARLILCNIPNSWAADFFNTIRQQRPISASAFRGP
jgi:hypothetical protein